MRALAPGVKLGLGMTSSGSISSFDAEAGAGRAGAVRAVEGEVARLDLADADAADRAGEVLREDQLLGARRVDLHGRDDDAAAQLQRRLDRVGSRVRSAVAAVAVQLLLDVVPADDQAVDDDLDRVLLVLRPASISSSRSRTVAVDAHADEAGAAHVLEDALVLALAVARSAAPGSCSRVPSGSARTASTICCDRLLRDRPAAVRAVRVADAREEQAQVVVDLGDGADGRARVAAGALLVDRDRRARGPRCSRRRASPSGRGTGGRRPTAIRRSAAAPRRRSCRRPATTCPSRTGR